MGPLFQLPIPTSDGIFLAHYSEQGLAGLDFPKSDWQRALAAEDIQGVPPVGFAVSHPTPETKAGDKTAAQVLRWHKTTSDALKSVLSGRTAKTMPPLDWRGTTEFQQSVWREMLKIDAGKTKSYGEIAAAIGKPKAVRAVGGACGANPIPVLVPCHRVLAANNKLGGFSSGLAWKRKLLAMEGVAVTQALP